MATAAPAATGTGSASASASASATAAKRKPVFIKVDQLKPGTSGHTLTVKVVSAKTVLQKGRSASLNPRPTRIAECLVGDETGTIVFTARNEQSIALSLFISMNFVSNCSNFIWWLDGNGSD